MEIGKFFRKPSVKDLEGVQPKYRRAIVQQRRKRGAPYVGAGNAEDLRFVEDENGHTRIVAKVEAPDENYGNIERGLGDLSVASESIGSQSAYDAAADLGIPVEEYLEG